MHSTRQSQPAGIRIAQCALAVALAFGAATAFAQSIYKHVDGVGHVSYTDSREAPIVARELPPLPVVAAPPASGIRNRSRNASAQSSVVNRKEAHRRLLQAKRELARGPDMQQGIPPGGELVPGDRRRARLILLQRSVEGAEARNREVNAADYVSDREGSTAPVSLAHNAPVRIQ